MEMNKNEVPDVKKFNEQLKLNNLEPMTSDEVASMMRFKKAYQIEMKRRSKIRKKVKLVLWIMVIVIAGIMDIMSIEIIDLIIELWRL